MSTSGRLVAGLFASVIVAAGFATVPASALFGLGATVRAQAPAPAPAVRTLASGLDAPWDLAFMPDRRALLTERDGFVRILSRDRLGPRQRVAGVVPAGEGGLLGVAVDPSFQRNRFVYLYRTISSGNVVTRYRFTARNRLSGGTNIVRGLAKSNNHNAGRIRFGPDRRLYVPTGDAEQPQLAQSASSLNGKVLRLGPRGYRGRGAGLETFSRGHRNSQGLDWHPRTRQLVATEHGPTGQDEVNVIRRGQNYGWPNVVGPATQAGVTSPIRLYDPAVAPSGATFVRRSGSAWTGSYLFATLRGQAIRRITFGPGLQPAGEEVLFQNVFGRMRGVTEGPDGAIYAVTSNTGSSRPPQGDRLLKIRPPRR